MITDAGMIEAMAPITTTLMIIFALAWLLFETKWLTVRLPYGAVRPSISEFLNIALGMVFLVVGLSISPLFGIPPNIPKYYRRYIQRVRKNTGNPFWLPDRLIREKVKETVNENS